MAIILGTLDFLPELSLIDRAIYDAIVTLRVDWKIDYITIRNIAAELSVKYNAPNGGLTPKQQEYIVDSLERLSSLPFTADGYNGALLPIHKARCMTPYSKHKTILEGIVLDDEPPLIRFADRKWRVGTSIVNTPIHKTLRVIGLQTYLLRRILQAHQAEIDIELEMLYELAGVYGMTKGGFDRMWQKQIVIDAVDTMLSYWEQGGLIASYKTYGDEYRPTGVLVKRKQEGANDRKRVSKSSQMD